MQFFLRRKFRLGAAEHDLDAVAAFVATLVVFDDLVPDFSARDAGRDTLLLQGIAEPVGIIASVCQHPLRFGQTVEQSGLASVVADLSGRQEEADRTTIRIASLLSVRSAIVDQIKEMDRRLRVIASQSQACEILMTIPGVGVQTSAAFAAAIDGAGRFRQSRNVGAYFGLVPRRHQSGEIDWTGRITKQGDGMVRKLLYEAANSILTRSREAFALKTWAMRIAKRRGLTKARVALARRLAVIMHAMLRDGTLFQA